MWKLAAAIVLTPGKVSSFGDDSSLNIVFSSDEVMCYVNFAKYVISLDYWVWHSHEVYYLGDISCWQKFNPMRTTC